jgi:hypothetical protein
VCVVITWGSNSRLLDNIYFRYYIRIIILLIHNLQLNTLDVCRVRQILLVIKYIYIYIFFQLIVAFLLKVMDCERSTMKISCNPTLRRSERISKKRIFEDASETKDKANNKRQRVSPTNIDSSCTISNIQTSIPRKRGRPALKKGTVIRKPTRWNRNDIIFVLQETKSKKIEKLGTKAILQ